MGERETEREGERERESLTSLSNCKFISFFTDRARVGMAGLEVTFQVRVRKEMKIQEVMVCHSNLDDKYESKDFL